MYSLFSMSIILLESQNITDNVRHYWKYSNLWNAYSHCVFSPVSPVLFQHNPVSKIHKDRLCRQNGTWEGNLDI